MNRANKSGFGEGWMWDTANVYLKKIDTFYLIYQFYILIIYKSKLLTTTSLILLIFSILTLGADIYKTSSNLYILHPSNFSVIPFTKN